MATKYLGRSGEVNALNAYIALRRANNTIAADLGKHLLEHELTGGQFGVLEALFHLGSLTQKELGKKLLSTKGNITMIIDNLENRSLVKRVADANDRRVALVQLTQSGNTLISKIVPKHVEKITKIMSVLTIQEMKLLKQLCKKLGLSINNF